MHTQLDSPVLFTDAKYMADLLLYCFGRQKDAYGVLLLAFKQETAQSVGYYKPRILVMLCPMIPLSFYFELRT